VCVCVFRGREMHFDSEVRTRGRKSETQRLPVENNNNNNNNNKKVSLSECNNSVRF